MVECVENIVNIDVLVRFLLFRFSTIGRSTGMLWQLILGAFWVPLAPFLWFRGVPEMGWNFDVFWDPPGEAQGEWMGSVEG